MVGEAKSSRLVEPDGRDPADDCDDLDGGWICLEKDAGYEISVEVTHSGCGVHLRSLLPVVSHSCRAQHAVCQTPSAFVSAVRPTWKLSNESLIYTHARKEDSPMRCCMRGE